MEGVWLVAALPMLAEAVWGASNKTLHEGLRASCVVCPITRSTPNGQHYYKSEKEVPDFQILNSNASSRPRCGRQILTPGQPRARCEVLLWLLGKVSLSA